ncbi:MAG: purine-nucleoside phosphorylase [Deltaproteobacteria bacterium]|nr:purine-nucleoside phosphorylase [Deltaproteobacteria bacterium]MCW5807409.1 purine-nucleoside phosphorylase [Deltaproteobacteria bacterium]
MSVHLEARPGEIAPIVLLPGDPLRAQFIAEKFLVDAVCHSRVRNALGFTGIYRNVRVSVQSTGMGMPSAAIYVHELLTAYGAHTLVRIGTCGGIRADLRTRDLVLAQAAATDSAMFRATFGGATYAASASFDLLQRAHALAVAQGRPVRVGTVLTSDTFYPDERQPTPWWTPWAEHGVLAAEMETAAVYTLAARRGARALSILTVSDNLITGEQTTADERQTGFGDMAALALELVTEPS